eukprot:gene13232-17735_t
MKFKFGKEFRSKRNQRNLVGPLDFVIKEGQEIPATVEIEMYGVQDSFHAVKYGIVMPKYAGFISQYKKCEEQYILKWSQQIASALRVIHSVGICHNDVKPDNIFLDINGDAHLGDYGGACDVDNPIKEMTTSYYPPDAGDTAKILTDFFLLGCVVLEMNGTCKVSEGPLIIQKIKDKLLLSDKGSSKFVLSIIVETERVIS